MPLVELVGRDAELTELAATLRLDDPRATDREAVLLAGDAGVGKTRLLHALRDRAIDAGWQVAAGHCLDLGDHGLPYLPFTEILGRLQQTDPEAVAEVLSERPALARLRPGERMLGTDEDAREVTRWTDLFDAIHDLFDRIAADRPLLVVVEDLHWADQSTRDLLTLLFSRDFAHPVALVASYRSDDLHRRHPLRATAVSWTRMPTVTRIQLAPLDEPHVRTLITRLHPDPLAERAVSGIVDRAEGNAFFVEELVQVADTHDGVPENLADLLLVRVDELSAEALQVLRVMAAVGRRTSHEMLAVGSDLDPRALDTALREALERQLLVASGDDGYRFRHALLAEAVYDDLLPGERKRLHTRLADALQDGAVRGTAAELARHAYAAGELVTAAESSCRAGDDAMAIGGPREAARSYENALELLAQPEVRRAADVDPVEVAVDLAAALVAAGDLARALRFGQRVLRQLPPDTEPRSRARLLVSLAGTVLVSDSTIDPVELTTEALELIPEERSEVRARALHLHARGLGLGLARSDAQIAQARETAVEALAISEHLAMARLSADIQTTLAGLAQADGTGLEASLVEVARSATAAEATPAALRAWTLLGRWRLEQGQFEEADRAFASAVEQADATGHTWAPYGFDARFHRIQLAFITGDWERADALLHAPRRGAQSLQLSLLAAAELHLVAGRGDRLDPALERAARDLWEQDGMIAMTAGPELITLAGRRRDRDEALLLHERVVRTLEQLWDKHFAGLVRLAAVTIGALAEGVDTLGARQRAALAEAVEEVADPAAEVVRRVHAAPRPWGPDGVAWERRLQAELLRFRWLSGVTAPEPDALVAAWRSDLDGFTAWGHLLEEARSRLRLGQVLKQLGDPEARLLLAQAREVGERLGARPLLDETPAARGADPDALTGREREVLGLVAAGRTNGEIAKQLFIATKTASVHVSNILAKLGAASRTEAAAIARDRGLV